MQLHLSAAAGDVADVSRRLNAGALVDETARPGLFSLDHGFTALMYATRSRQAGSDTLDVLLRSGADPNHLSDPPLRRTPLILAVGSGDLAKVRCLIAAGADVNLQAMMGMTAIHAALSCPAATREEMVRTLAEAGADLLSVSQPGFAAMWSSGRWTSIESAAKVGHFDMVQMLIAAGADAAVLEWTPLMTAVALGSIEDVQRVLDSKTDLFINSRDRWHRTAMLLAVQTGDVDKAAAVHAAGGQLTDIASRKQTALSSALSGDHGAMLRWLIDRGLDVNAATESGETPLMTAAFLGAADCVRTLLAAGADPSARDALDSCVMGRAANAEIVALLVAAGEDINEVDMGYSLLATAAEGGNVEMVRDLLAMGADPDAASLGGETALHKAARHDQREIVRLLLAAGANPNHTEADDYTPLFSARSVAVARMLLDAGANPDAKNICGDGIASLLGPEVRSGVERWKAGHPES